VDRNQDHAFWCRNAIRYDGSLKLFGAAFPRMLELVREGLADAGSVIEVGAGTGRISQVIAPSLDQFVATDFAAPMLAILRRRLKEAGCFNIDCILADLHRLPFAPGRFDAVVAGNVLHVVPDVGIALDSLIRVLRPGGKLIVPTFCHGETRFSSLISRLLTRLGQPVYHRFKGVELTRTLVDSGFQCLRAEIIAGPIPVAYLEAVNCPGR